MQDYKPYPFLYKGVPASNKVTVSFYVNLSAGEDLGSPDITFDLATNTTTLTYEVVSGSSRRPELKEEVISWNGNRATVHIVIEKNGGGVGSAVVNTSEFD